MQFVKENVKWTTVAWTNVSMTLAMQLDLTMKFLKYLLQNRDLKLGKFLEPLPDITVLHLVESLLYGLCRKM